jgi:hypothetical protein
MFETGVDTKWWEPTPKARVDCPPFASSGVVHNATNEA